MQKYWLWLATVQGLTLRQKHKLLKRYPHPEDIYGLSDEEIFQAIASEPAALERDLTQAEKILNSCLSKGIDILPIGEDAYPLRLKEIGDAPIVLYYKGIWPDFEAAPMIGVVGTRKATTYGKNCASRLSKEITVCGGIVVSGGAEGVDTYALQGALDGEGMPVAVLGCGVDIAYPPTNRRLFNQISQKGCLVSEYPPGTKPAPWQFPARNRIISGLSNGSLVIEAPDKSGALITAQLALEQGRDVMVVPGNIDVLTCAGSNRLLRDGAIAVGSGWDVLSEYEAQYPDKIHKDTSPVHQSAYPDEVEKVLSQKEKPLKKVAQKLRLPVEKEKPEGESDKKVIDKGPAAPYIDLNDILPKLSEEERAIVTALKDGQRLVDDVIAETGLTTGKMLACMTMLELKGVIRRLPGKYIILK